MPRSPMFRPDDPLSPPEPVFAEPWHAQALALSNALVSGGTVTPSEWAEALGAELRLAEARGAPDTSDTYFNAVLQALETVSETQGGIDRDTRLARRAAWEKAYHRTPHGQPVQL